MQFTIKKTLTERWFEKVSLNFRITLFYDSTSSYSEKQNKQQSYYAAKGGHYSMYYTIHNKLIQPAVYVKGNILNGSLSFNQDRCCCYNICHCIRYDKLRAPKKKSYAVSRNRANH